MSLQSLDKRLAALEREVSELRKALANGKRTKDWRRTIGMFAGDEIMKQIDEETLKLREADRRRARRRQPQKAKLGAEPFSGGDDGTCNP
jgi:hypothetical protein